MRNPIGHQFGELAVAFFLAFPVACSGTPSGSSCNIQGVAGSAASGACADSGAGGAGGACAQGPSIVPGDKALWTDFTEVPSGSFGVDTSSGNATTFPWGTMFITGNTFFYQQENSDGMRAAIASGALRLTAALASNHYTAFGLYFDSNCGMDACFFSGISFSTLGSLGGSTLDIQVQMSADFPIFNGKGTCNYLAADGARWSYCKNPHVLLDSIVPGGITATATTVHVSWNELLGGSPVSGIDCHQLLALQLQFNCGSAACPIDVTLDDVSFY